MRRALAVALLAVPTVLAFIDGATGSGAAGGRDRVWLLVAIGALTAPVPFPQGVAARAAVGGLAALLVLTLVSLSWAPLLGPAYGDAQRLALYLGALIAALALLGPARATEPLLPPAPGSWCWPACPSDRARAGHARPLAERGRPARAAARLLERHARWPRWGSRCAQGSRGTRCVRHP
jgi:hypothetical protein